MSEELKNKLKLARERLKLSQAGMARALGVNVRTLQTWEQNQRTPSPLALEALTAKLDSLLKK